MRGARGDPAPGQEFRSTTAGIIVSCARPRTESGHPSLILDEERHPPSEQLFDDAPYEGLDRARPLHWRPYPRNSILWRLATTLDRSMLRSARARRRCPGEIMSPPDFRSLRASYGGSGARALEPENSRIRFLVGVGFHKGGETFGYRVSDGKGTIAPSRTTADEHGARPDGGASTRGGLVLAGECAVVSRRPDTTRNAEARPALARILRLRGVLAEGIAASACPLPQTISGPMIRAM